MIIRRFGRPGLIGLAARTAVVAGTATAVSGAMTSRRNRMAQQETRVATTVAPDVAPSPGASPSPLLDELERLSTLREQNALTDDEFAAAKQRLLST